MARSEVKQYLTSLNANRVPDTIGNKSRNLRALIQKGLPVPTTYVIGWDAYDGYVQNDVNVIHTVQAEIRARLDFSKTYAVRSSANIEDSLEHSFAGQFKTVLNLRGEAQILQAIWSVWATAQSPGVQTYLTKLPPQQRALHMAVILQEMVKPVVSGVSFSRNPVTGEDQVVVEAVQGLGTSLVQEGTTPLHWVNQRGRWLTLPKDSPVDQALIEKVVAETRHIVDLFKADVDLEWVYDGQELYWVQMREITTTKSLIIYSNRIAREVLPGMIKPLVWSVNVPMINAVWVQVLTELVGKNDLKIDDLAKSLYYRAYFNLSALGRIWNLLGMPRESLEMIMGVIPRPEGKSTFKPTGRMIRLMPRLLSFAIKKWRLGKQFKRDYPLLVKKYHSYPIHNLSDQSPTELLARIDQLYADLQPAVYYNINVPILMAAYHALFGRQLKKLGAKPEQFDIMYGFQEHLEFDPETSLKDLRKVYASLSPAVQQEIAACSVDEFQRMPGISTFQDQFNAFIKHYGHLSDSGNDFSVVPWREKANVVLRLITQEVPEDHAPVIKPNINDLKLPKNPIFRIWIKMLHGKARLSRLHREQISFLYTYAYGLFRPYFLAIGEHFTLLGIFSKPEDIFYLNLDEVREVINDSGKDRTEKGIRSLVEKRRVEMDRCQDVSLPALIYGDVAPILNVQLAEKLTGVATSSGYYSGPLKVVHGLEDFQKVQPGDVLVIPYSDVGWTPLFARAGAVVAESGGMLSHTSIIAREYHIPAVVSVAGAMQLRDGDSVTVDGYRGEVLLHAER